MYLEHFELKEAPFSITPDPRFVFLTAQHRDAMAHLLFGITQGGGGGFVQLTGEVGTGKTTLCRLLMAQVPDNVRIALVLNPMQQPLELLRTICDELRILLPKRNSSIKVLTDALTRYLLESYAAGLRVVVVLDEAQNLSFECLEQVRLLTNLETPTQKLLQIILLGQPELREVLARVELRQLSQRITARFHLAPLSREDTHAYVEHRLAVAGRRRPLFAASALDELFRQTRGYPRSINVVADRALLGAYARGQESVDVAMVRTAAREVGGTPIPERFRAASWIAAACLLAAVSGLAWWANRDATPSATVAQIAASELEVAPLPASLSIDEIQPFDDGADAMKIVAGWWSSELPGAAQHCNVDDKSGSLCARLRLNEALLRELDRPLALQLHSGESRRWFALRRLNEHTAQVAGPQRLTAIPWLEIEAGWLGDAMLVVRRPPSYAGEVIAVGAEGPGVVLVHDAVAALDGVARPDEATAAYDTGTSMRVRALQDRYGLRADGLIGPETMALLTALAAEGPRLSEPVADGAFVSGPQQ